MKIILHSVLGLLLFCIPPVSQAQSNKDSILLQASLDQCIQFALAHQEAIQQSLLDEQITERQIKSKLADWYPQLNLNYNYQYNFQLPALFFNGGVVQSGAKNISTAGVSFTQNLFNRDVLLASRSANDLRRQFKQNTSNTKIDITVNVIKAFYDVLLTSKQSALLAEERIRLERSLKDATNQYQGGLVDKTDFKRATIALNNTKAQQKANQEQLKYKMAFLKQQMGYLPTNEIELIYDSTKMMADIYIDTTLSVKLEDRIEFQQLETARKLQVANLKYYKWSYYPTVAAFGSYNLGGFFSNSFSKLYAQNYASSFAGLQLAFPIFQGTKRIQQIKMAELELKKLDWNLSALKTAVATEYAQALAVYKSNLIDYYLLKDNQDLAKEVYHTIELQYRAGIKTYLDVITAETDLHNASFTYTNALYQVLSSKAALQKALGAITY